MSLRVGILGLGLMGEPMARNMITAGWNVIGWTRRIEVAQSISGLTVACRPEDLADCNIILSVLPDLAPLEEILAGSLGSALSPGTILVICSTSSPVKVVDLAKRLETKEILVVDAPISGGVLGAQEARLAIMVGGENKDVDKVMPLLRSCGNPVHLGPLGAGEIAKACNQMIVSATTIGLVEAALLAEKSGLNVAAMFELLGTGLAGSELLRQKMAKLVNHDHSVSGPAKFFVKDLNFALLQGEQVGVELLLANKMAELWKQMVEAGYGDLDTTALQAYLEKISSK